MKRIAFLAVIGLLSISFSGEIKEPQQAAIVTDPRIQQIIAGFDQQLKAEVEQEGIGSISYTIFIGDEMIASKGLGKTDNEKGTAPDTATVYRIGSLSKSITSYLMMLLVQNGTIQLDDPVVKYVPEIAQVKQNGGNEAITITLRQLASHSSGLPREPSLADLSAGPVSEWENAVLAAIPVTTMESSPGTRYSYSNIGYAILGLALERAAKKPFIGMVQDMVFGPLGMNSSFYSVPGGYETRLATGYHKFVSSGKVDTERPRKELTGRGYRVPNGGVFSIPADYARFMMAQVRKNDQLGAKYRKMMQTIQIHTNGNSGYGLGLSVSDNKDLKLVGHSGEVSGFSSFMLFSPEYRVGVVMMRNYDIGFSRVLPATRGLVRDLANVLK